MRPASTRRTLRRDAAAPLQPNALEKFMRCREVHDPNRHLQLPVRGVQSGLDHQSSSLYSPSSNTSPHVNLFKTCNAEHAFIINYISTKNTLQCLYAKHLLTLFSQALVSNRGGLVLCTGVCVFGDALLQIFHGLPSRRDWYPFILLILVCR